MLVPMLVGIYQRFMGTAPKAVVPKVRKRRIYHETQSRDPRFEPILQAVSAFYGIPVTCLKSSQRDARTALARHVACYLAYKQNGLSYPAIGRLLGNRDHTTILHGVRRIEKLLAAGDENVAFAIIAIGRGMT